MLIKIIANFPLHFEGLSSTKHLQTSFLCSVFLALLNDYCEVTELEWRGIWTVAEIGKSYLQDFDIILLQEPLVKFGDCGREESRHYVLLWKDKLQQKDHVLKAELCFPQARFMMYCRLPSSKKDYSGLEGEDGTVTSSFQAESAAATSSPMYPPPIATTFLAVFCQPRGTESEQTTSPRSHEIPWETALPFFRASSVKISTNVPKILVSDSKIVLSIIRSFPSRSTGSIGKTHFHF